MTNIPITSWQQWLVVSAEIAMNGHEVRNYESLFNGGMRRISDDGLPGRPYRVIVAESLR